MKEVQAIETLKEVEEALRELQTLLLELAVAPSTIPRNSCKASLQ